MAKWWYIWSTMKVGELRSKNPRFLVDVNNDGRADDIVGYGNYGVYVSFSRGVMFTDPLKIYDGFGYEGGGWRVEKHPRLVADVNGESFAQLVGFGTSATYIEPLFYTRA